MLHAKVKHTPAPTSSLGLVVKLLSWIQFPLNLEAEYLLILSALMRLPERERPQLAFNFWEDSQSWENRALIEVVRKERSSLAISLQQELIILVSKKHSHCLTALNGEE